MSKTLEQLEKERDKAWIFYVTTRLSDEPAITDSYKEYDVACAVYRKKLKESADD